MRACRYGEDLKQGWALRRVPREDVRAFLDRPPISVDPLAVLAEEPDSKHVTVAVSSLIGVQTDGGGARPLFGDHRRKCAQTDLNLGFRLCVIRLKRDRGGPLVQIVL